MQSAADQIFAVMNCINEKIGISPRCIFDWEDFVGTPSNYPGETIEKKRIRAMKNGAGIRIKANEFERLGISIDDAVSILFKFKEEGSILDCCDDYDPDAVFRNDFSRPAMLVLPAADFEERYLRISREMDSSIGSKLDQQIAAIERMKERYLQEDRIANRVEERLRVGSNETIKTAPPHSDTDVVFGLEKLADGHIAVRYEKDGRLFRIAKLQVNGKPESVYDFALERRGAVFSIAEINKHLKDVEHRDVIEGSLAAIFRGLGFVGIIGAAFTRCGRDSAQLRPHITMRDLASLSIPEASLISDLERTEEKRRKQKKSSQKLGKVRK